MKLLYIDIENTIIDNLTDCNFLEENCEKIKRFIKNESVDAWALFTWGWKTSNEIDMYLVEDMAKKLDLHKPVFSYVVATKNDSINYAVKAGWLHEEDRERTLQPGMMAEFGISKISCFFEMCRVANVYEDTEIILIDDLANGTEVETHKSEYGTLTAKAINPTELT